MRALFKGYHDTYRKRDFRAHPPSPIYNLRNFRRLLEKDSTSSSKQTASVSKISTIAGTSSIPPELYQLLSHRALWQTRAHTGSNPKRQVSIPF